MAHFAHIVNGGVTEVFVVANEVITDSDGVEQEALGQEFLAGLFGSDADSFVQCSYNGTFRGVYPAPGFTYDPVTDVFAAPKPSEVPDDTV